MSNALESDSKTSRTVTISMSRASPLTTGMVPQWRFIIFITTGRTGSVFLDATRAVDMTSWASRATFFFQCHQKSRP